MNKKVYTLLTFLLFFSLIINAQTTYYWVGGNGASTTPGTAAITWGPASWNTQPDSSGLQRTVNASNDILIFDGNSPKLTINNKNIYVANMPSDTVGQVKFLNGVFVNIITTAALPTNAGTYAYGAYYGNSTQAYVGTGTDFTTSLKKGDYIFGNAYTNMVQVLSVSSNTDITVSNEATGTLPTAPVTYTRATTLYIKGNPGLFIDATSTLSLASNITGFNFIPLVISVQPGATALINGTLNFANRGNGSRLVGLDPGSIVFSSGSTCSMYVNAIAKNYYFGSTGGTGSAALGAASGAAGGYAGGFVYNTTSPAIVFQANSNFRHASLALTPFGPSYNAAFPLVFSPPVSFLPNSNYIFSYTNAYQPYFFSNGASFGNLIWNSTGTPGGTSTTTFYLNPARIDTLNVIAMGTPTNSTNAGRILLYGDYINNSASGCNFGSINFVGSGNLQKISGTSTSDKIANIIVNDQANVLLAKNIPITASVNVLGKLDLSTFVLTGSGTPYFTNAAYFNKTYNKAAGVTSSSSPCGIVVGSKIITVSGVSAIPVGTTVTSSSHPTLFPAGTFVVSYGGSGLYTLSKAATMSADSTSTPTLAANFSTAAGTVVTSNAGGLDASLPTFTTFNLNNSANFTFNTATLAPFPASVASPLWIGNLTLGAPISVNKQTLNVNGSVTLANNNLTIPTGDSVIVKFGNSVTGSATGFVDTKIDLSTGAKGVLGIEGFATARTFPVGTNGNYLPVTITPDTTSNYYVTAFNGLTANATPNGTAFTAAQKDTSVNAVYLINRTSPATSRTANVTLGYPTGLKGTTFSGYTNQIGISGFDGTSWLAPIGSGSNTTNIAAGDFTAFNAFYVTHYVASSTLPVRIVSISASFVNSTEAKVNWTVAQELNVDHYIVERSVNGITFTPVATITASGLTTYSILDAAANSATVYYRIQSVDKGNPNIKFSQVVSINNKNKSVSVNVYPNPVSGGQLNVQFANLQKGNISVSLYNLDGRNLLNNFTNYNGGSVLQTIKLPVTITAGTYNLIIRDGVNTINKKVFITQ